MTAAPTYDRAPRPPVVPVLNLPNVLTLGRLVVVPFFAALLLLDGTSDGTRVLAAVLFVLAIPDPLEQPFGVDVALYREAAARWFAGGAFYESHQLAGPYEVAHGDILYPPVGLWLFVPIALLPVVPALVLWWGVPAAVTVWAIRRLGPRPAAWPLIALCLAWPTTPLKVWTGNPVIWSVAAMAIAMTTPAPARIASASPSRRIIGPAASKAARAQAGAVLSRPANAPCAPSSAGTRTAATSATYAATRATRARGL